MSVCVSVSQSVSLSVSLCVTVCVSVCLSVCLSIVLNLLKFSMSSAPYRRQHLSQSIILLPLLSIHSSGDVMRPLPVSQNSPRVDTHRTSGLRRPETLLRRLINIYMMSLIFITFRNTSNASNNYRYPIFTTPAMFCGRLMTFLEHSLKRASRNASDIRRKQRRMDKYVAC